LRSLHFLRNGAVCGFEFTGVGGRNTAEARERPEIESYNRCVLCIACAMALFAGLILPASVGETQRRRASAPKLKVKPVAFFAFLAKWRCLRV
jgi:hypothetical protein